MRHPQSSLSRHVDTPLSDEEIGHRAHAAQHWAWHDAGIMVISLTDTTVPQGLRDMVEAVAIAKFGKRHQGVLKRAGA